MKRKRRLILFTITALGLLAIIGGVLEGASANTIPQAYLPYAWLALAVVALVTIGFLFWQFRLQDDSDENLTISHKQYRQILINRVRSRWIKDVLEKSLEHAAFIVLGLKENSNAVAKPRNLTLKYLDELEYALPTGTRISQVYDNAGGELLILGDPGSGKTTLLLELAQDLLHRAEQDAETPIPVVFNLSTWAVKRQPLKRWLIEELNNNYHVQRQLGENLVDNDKISFLLDGLDEVNLTYRKDCFKAINIFRIEHGIAPIVICSRKEDYLSQSNRIEVQTAVVVQPLTEKQIDDYLSSGGAQLAPIRVALRNDSVLQELVTTPLMLTILTIAYHGTSVEDLLVKGSLEAQRKQIFETYVSRMYHRRGQEKSYPSFQTTRWLVCLAKELMNREQASFKSGLLPLSWFSTSSICRFYRSVAATIAFGLWYYLLLANFFENDLAIVIASLLGISTGLIVGLTHFRHIWQILAIICSISFGITVGFIVREKNELIIGFSFGLVAAITGLILNGMLSTSIQSLSIKDRLYLSFDLYDDPLTFFELSPDGFKSHNEMISILIFGPLGLYAWLEYYLMRLHLAIFGPIPWNYRYLLDYAVDCILLRKIGNDYIFVHRLLLEYFASLDTTPTDNSNAQQKKQMRA